MFVVLGGVAGGYYLWLDAKVSGANERVPDDVRQALAEDPTATAESPDAMNILLLGSDTRSSTLEGSRSDTVILVHLDPDNDYLSVLSLPRDLRVSVEGYGTRKLNFAYAKGGPALMIKTVQQVTGVDIDHYLELDFWAFTEMTDHLGGVYVEVDRPYHYDSDAYEKISLEPGYQLLDGNDALDYARFRHDANYDFGRMERQQRFLAALREQAMGWDLGVSVKLPGLIGVLFDNVATDMGTNDFLKLVWWGVRLDGERIRQVKLRGICKMIGGVTFVICSEEQITEAVQTMRTPPGTEGAIGETAAATELPTTTTIAVPEFSAPASPSTIPNSAVWKAVATKVPFAVQAPAYIPDDYRILTRSGTYAYVYKIRVGDGEQPALVMLYRNRGTGGPGEAKLEEEYMNVTETTWLDAPAASAGREVTHDGTVFTIVGSAGKVERIWWKSDGVLYWVSNTLSRVASEDELLAVAESMIPIPSE